MFFSYTFSGEKPGPREIHKYVIARGLRYGKPHCIPRVAA